MKRNDSDNRKHEAMDREKNRFEESRHFETHDANKRAVMNMSWMDPLHFDPEEIPEGVEYKWVRESVLGQPDISRSVETRRKMWTVVPAERHPDRVADDYFGRLSHMKGFIYYKGLVLCERPKEYAAMEMKEAAKRNYKVLSDLPSLNNNLGEASMPLTDTSQTYYGAKDISFA